MKEKNMQNIIQKCREKLYSAVIADTMDSIGFHKQVLKPGIVALDPSIKLCGLARVGLYMPIYHDDENVNVYEHEIALIDSLKTDEVAVFICNSNQNIANSRVAKKVILLVIRKKKKKIVILSQKKKKQLLLLIGVMLK